MQPAAITLRNFFTGEMHLLSSGSFEATSIHSSELFAREQTECIQDRSAFSVFSDPDTRRFMTEEDKRGAINYMQSPIRRMINSELFSAEDRSGLRLLLQFNISSDNIERVHDAYESLRRRVEASDFNLSMILRNSDRERRIYHGRFYVYETPEQIKEAIINTNAQIMARAIQYAKAARLSPS